MKSENTNMFCLKGASFSARLILYPSRSISVKQITVEH